MKEKHFEKQMKRQAIWLEDLRNQLYRRANLRIRHEILEVGCGSGIICRELKDRSLNNVTAVDSNSRRIENLKNIHKDIDFIWADAHDLPFNNNSFDLIVTSWLWLWIKDLNKFATEIKRLLKPGGVYISLAEIDMEAKIEYPPEMEIKKKFFIESLKHEGADPFVARKLKALFNEPELNTSCGAFTNMFNNQQLLNDLDEDWNHIKLHLKDYPENFMPEIKWDNIYNAEKEAIENKTRFSFMPVFWLYIVKAT